MKPVDTVPGSGSGCTKCMNCTELTHATFMRKVQRCRTRDSVIDFAFDICDVLEMFLAEGERLD
jgi:hypothetical protein